MKNGPNPAISYGVGLLDGAVAVGPYSEIVATAPGVPVTDGTVPMAAAVVVMGTVALPGGVIEGVPGPGVGTVGVAVGGTTGGVVTRLAKVPWAAVLNNTT
jgi:hypothetical protein